jgi:hypothetical protein
MNPEPPLVLTDISVMAAMMTAMIKKEKNLNLNNRFTCFTPFAQTICLVNLNAG